MRRRAVIGLVLIGVCVAIFQAATFKTSEPFFLMHHFKAPHDMFVYAPRYESYLVDVEFPEPTNLYGQPGPDFGSIATRGSDDSLVGTIGSTISPQKTKRNLTSRQGYDRDNDLPFPHPGSAEKRRDGRLRFLGVIREPKSFLRRFESA